MGRAGPRLTPRQMDQINGGQISSGPVDRQRSSDAEPLSAFGATRPNDRTATTRLHANQKTVGAFTTGYRGLERAFHRARLSSYRTKAFDYSGPQRSRQVVLADSDR
jgi:hypothetical protein